VLKDEVMKGYVQSTQAGLPDVARHAVVLAGAGRRRHDWRCGSSSRQFAGVRQDPAAAFFFSNPVDVFSQIVKWFWTGVIWKHLAITLVGIDPRLP